MPYDVLQTLGALMPLTARTDARALTCALDRLADPALTHVRARFAEYLAQRAARTREAAR